MTLKTQTLASIRDVIAASDPRHDNRRPAVDAQLLWDAINELIILHMDGKASREDQVIFDDVLARLKNPRARKRAEAMTRASEIDKAISDLVDEIATL